MARIDHSPRGCPRIKTTAKLLRMQSQCPPKTYLHREPAKSPKLKTYRNHFLHTFAAVKAKYGHGVYSYSEGMNRRAARKIARTITRNIIQKHGQPASSRSLVNA